MRSLLIGLSAHPWAVLVVFAAITGFALAGIVDPTSGRARLRIDPSVDSLITHQGEAAAFHDRARRLFGGDEPVILALTGPQLFSVEGLDRIARLSQRLEALPEVRRVLSLTTAINIRARDGAVDVAPFLATVPEALELREALRDAILANPLYAGTLLSENAHTTALFVHLRDLGDSELIDSGIVARIEQIASDEAGGFALSLSGVPYIKVETSKVLLRSFGAILPAILVLSGLVLLLAFKSLRGLLLPLAAMTISLVWTLGAMGWLGYSLNLVTIIIPPLIMTLGFASSMHILSGYYECARERPEAEKGSSVLPSLFDDVALPVAITSLTTAVGFASLMVSPLWTIRQFGEFSVLGVASAMLASLIFIPAVLGLLPLPGPRARQRGSAFLERASFRLGNFSFFNRRAIIMGAIGLLLVCGLSMSRIEVGTDYITDFPVDSRVRRDYELINRELGGANGFFIVLESPIPNAFLQPSNLEEIRALQMWLAQQPEVGSSSSLADYLMLLNRALHDGSSEFFRVPDSRALASQLLLFGSSRETDRMLDADGQSTVVRVRTRTQNTSEITQLVARIEQHLAVLEAPTSARVTGSVIMLSRTIDDIARGQLRGLALAMLLIYLVLWAMFTSARIGLVALLPNLLPIGLYFGGLAICGISLNASTSLIACIALGIAVDDTIHYFARFNRDAKRSTREVPATQSALRAVLRPATLTSLGLCLGFAMLMASEFQSQAQFGLLTAFTLAAAWVIDITLTPALCCSVRIVTLWDVLRLDLGSQPQHDNEFFRGLSLRQARVVALMGTLEEKQMGEPLRAGGEVSGDLYIVLEGELVCWLERDGDRNEIGSIGKGGVVDIEPLAGRSLKEIEVRSRTARLMRFSTLDLERLMKRYPRIAAKVYRNLCHIEAERGVTLLEWMAQEKARSV